jgi:hypothetical protein
MREILKSLGSTFETAGLMYGDSFIGSYLKVPQEFGPPTFSTDIRASGFCEETLDLAWRFPPADS